MIFGSSFSPCRCCGGSSLVGTSYVLVRVGVYTYICACVCVFVWARPSLVDVVTVDHSARNEKACYTPVLINSKACWSDLQKILLKQRIK